MRWNAARFPSSSVTIVDDMIEAENEMDLLKSGLRGSSPFRAGEMERDLREDLARV